MITAIFTFMLIGIKCRFLKITILLVLLVQICHAPAAVIEDLYQAKIAVSDQSAQAQRNAFTEALKLVLVKVRGNQDLLNNAQIRQATRRATRMVSAYSYEREQSQLYLSVSFDATKIDSAIRSAGYPVWDKRRPDSLVWLVIEPEGQSTRELLTTENAKSIYQQLTSVAQKRGIELVFPLWDLQDRQMLTEYDIWGGFSQRIIYASERYGLPTILSARIHLHDESNVLSQDDLTNEPIVKRSSKAMWVGDWISIENKQISSGKVTGNDPEEVGRRLIHTLADMLSDKYAVDFASLDPAASRLQVTIKQVDSLVKYVEVLRFLKSLSVVNNANLIIQQGTDAVYELELLGDTEDLKNAFALDRSVQPIVDEFGQPIADFEYIWVGNE